MVSDTIAFDILDRASADFATAPIEEAFNWAAFAEATDLDRCYMVAFRSIRCPVADVALLEALDKVAHEDASTQPGYLFYFKGQILPGAQHLKNLSFCLWRTSDEAGASSRRPKHRKASAVAVRMYSSYEMEFYELVVHRSEGRAWIEFSPVAR